MTQLRPTTSTEDVQTSSGFPLLSGISLKPCYYQAILEEKPPVGFFEIHAENYLSAGGPTRHYLEKIREHYPVTVHGVGLSIGGESPLNLTHLEKVAQLVEWIEPVFFSEHLAWSSHFSHFFNDLLPLPYTQETLHQVCEHIEQVQERLKRPMLLENPSTYLRFKESTMDELEFVSAIVRRTGCQLLLDVNNVAVSCFNHQQDPYHYIEHFPGHSVRQIHLAGYAVDQNGTVPLRIDAHDREVTEDVWQLYRYTLQQWGDTPTLIEWDGQLPELAVLQHQADMADQIRSQLRPYQKPEAPNHAAAI
ncbi:MNIO family bufferin maturase [Vibrio mangrovi]|uniref:DUF692 domain-containing protein n=1 Tax=Vibrio mangrovi TaxID=474394 RepID=A0A1Y6IU69_9VIBR|nr:DUF692 domain-containing protein [Vibrio mangrovi]MDW6002985.1 DUF692 domain-containing protein [Vibrio mangrovi]SMS01227.1 hypothetical protein VIM7927_02509 [Vibrio mangrovi]